MGLETLDIVVCLTASHLLGDFLLQTDRMAGSKRNIRVLALHASVVTATSYLLCGAWLEWRILLGVFGSHLAIDGIKAASGKNGPVAFLLDQGGHLAVLTALGTYWIPGQVPYWQSLCPFYVRGILLLAGAILCIRAGGFWIGKMVAPYQAALAGVSESLPNAGRIIGQLERALIYFFVLAGELQGVGFLVAAKSILRFSEVKGPGQRREAEYILIGTLMSFVWGLLVAFATKALLSLVDSF